VEIIAWDTDEAIVEQIVDHCYMPSNKRSECGDSWHDSRAWVQRTMFGSLGAKLIMMSYRLWMA
jgi:hypothetical protein